MVPFRFERAHAEPDASDLPPLVLDRQRVLQSTAFRRLLAKTQVFVAPESDHFRTRLTHTLEVAHVARLLATALGLNADLAEVVALAHDLGHPPFGHAGERALDECLRAHGGFEHNEQSLRVVEYLEHPFPQFRGLNLTLAVRQCLARHQTRYDRPETRDDNTEPAPRESGVAAWADQIAYCLHDLQDGLFADLFGPLELASLRLWTMHYEGPRGDERGWRGHVRPALERIQAAIVRDLAYAAGMPRGGSKLNPVMAEIGPADGETKPGAGEIKPSAAMQCDFAALADFLRDKLYRHHRVLRSDVKARRIISAIFEAYVSETALLPPRYRDRVAEQGPHRVAADYIAGMTDRFCLDEHARLFDPRAAF